MFKARYGGHLLPKLPHWNKYEYPYACIIKQANNEYNPSDEPSDDPSHVVYHFYISNKPFKMVDKDHIVKDDTCEIDDRHYDSREVFWNVDGWPMNSETPTIPGPILWSNFDIYFEDGELYIAASEPEQVIDVEKTCKLMGYILGRKMINSRGKSKT